MESDYFDVQFIHARRMTRHRFQANWSGYDHYSFLLALEGRMRYQMDAGKIHHLDPPFLFWNHPDHHYRYGHQHAGEAWSHCYAAFSGERARKLMEEGFMSLGRPSFVRLSNPDYAIHAFDRIVNSFQQNQRYAAEEAMLILENIYLDLKKEQDQQAQETTGDTRIGDVIEAIRQFPLQPVDFEAWAKKRSMSYSNFRQLFRKQTQLAPHQFLMRERMHWARRQVIETRQPLQEIGFAIGYENPAVFSRAFSQYHHISASALRKSFRNDR